MDHVQVTKRNHPPVPSQPFEYVERKGLGHPDTICDSIMEAGSVALCRAYHEVAGRPLHHNVDKGLLVAGRSAPAFGGGRIVEPMKIVFGDRATSEFQSEKIPVGEIIRSAAGSWLVDNLRFIDLDRHVVFQNELKPGSPELTGIFERQTMVANDTSAAVGYAPFSETENLVFAAERFLNSAEVKAEFPEVGEDIKVMGIRRDRTVFMTVAIAFVDQFIRDANTYFDRKAAIFTSLISYLENQLKSVDQIKLAINTLDAADRGLGGVYLTVLGTSADGADSGQVGRGNRVNGLITLNRPMSTEAAAGKNPTSHVGKIYSVLSHQLAGRIHSAIEPVEEVYVWICSRIGQPISKPWSVSVDLNLSPGVEVEDVESLVRKTVEDEFKTIDAFTDRLALGEFSIC